jgi:hypothetical protein
MLQAAAMAVTKSTCPKHLLGLSGVFDKACLFIFFIAVFCNKKCAMIARGVGLQASLRHR